MIKMYEGQDRVFLACCEKARVQPTRRQYRKYQSGEGRAYQQRREVLKEYQLSQKA